MRFDLFDLGGEAGLVRLLGSLSGPAQEQKREAWRRAGGGIRTLRVRLRDLMTPAAAEALGRSIKEGAPLEEIHLLDAKAGGAEAAAAISRALLAWCAPRAPPPLRTLDFGSCPVGDDGA